MSNDFNTEIQDFADSISVPQPISDEETSQSWLTHPINQPESVIIEHNCTIDSIDYQNNLLKIYDMNSDMP